MKIKITRCSDSLFWYNHRIGDVFLVHRIEPDRYWCREWGDDGYLNFVLKSDCETEPYI